MWLHFTLSCNLWPRTATTKSRHQRIFFLLSFSFSSNKDGIKFVKNNCDKICLPGANVQQSIIDPPRPTYTLLLEENRINWKKFEPIQFTPKFRWSCLFQPFLLLFNFLSPWNNLRFHQLLSFWEQKKALYNFSAVITRPTC